MFQNAQKPAETTHTESGVKKHENLSKLCHFTARNAVKLSDQIIHNKGKLIIGGASSAPRSRRVYQKDYTRKKSREDIRKIRVL